MTVVDEEVTALKFRRELELWSQNEASYRRRGWMLLGQERFSVDIGFLAQLPLGPHTVPVMSASIRVDFTNYDLWAPSVEFIDPATGNYGPPLVQALVDSDEGPRDLVVQHHPDTARPFFCVPGVRQYHEHPQHSGDSWLLHRGSGEGRLATICDRVWRAMSRNLVGLQVVVQTMPAGQVELQLRLVNAPGDAAQVLAAQAERQRAATRLAVGEAGARSEASR